MGVHVIIFGCGGREVALAQAIARSRIDHTLHCIGGYQNPDMEMLVESYYVYHTTAEALDQATQIIQSAAHLCIIGPEALLADGLVDVLQARDIMCIGFPQAIAKLETDKLWCRKFLQQFGFQQYCPHFVQCNKLTSLTQIQEHLAHFSEVYGGYVIKPCGLTGGKGVKVSGDHFKDSVEAVQYAVSLGDFLIEEKLVGIEFSLMSLTDGNDTIDFPAVRDFKRADNGDKGPNTGGMGAICTTDYLVSNRIEEASRLNREVIHAVHLKYPSITRFTGILFGGFMDTPHGLKLLEYNCRFGDPEIIAALGAIHPDADVLRVLLHAAHPNIGVSKIPPGTLKAVTDCCAVYVCPEEYGRDRATVQHDVSLVYKVIKENPSKFKVICAGIKNVDGVIMTTGSRGFAFVANSSETILLINDWLEKHKKQLEGLRWRNDIAVRQNISRSSFASAQSTAYQRAGVNIDAQTQALAAIGSTVRTTHHEHVISIPNGFGGLCRVPGSRQILVSSTDSVGSKTEFVRQLATASNCGREDWANAMRGLGHDIVNHCVNDILVMGCVRPLTFLDYFATHTLEPEDLVWVVEGLSKACKVVGCALVGGETAEIKDTYKPGAIDLAGFITGVVTEDELLRPREKLSVGDAVIAIPSVSAHTNGYTLINSVLRKIPRPLSSEDEQWLQWLGKPHKCYLDTIRNIRNWWGVINGLVHITGGGLIDNPPRILPDGMCFAFDRNMILTKMPQPFRRLQKECGIPVENYNEMFQTFNCGIGMLVVVPQNAAEDVASQIDGSFIVGRIDTCLRLPDVRRVKFY